MRSGFGRALLEQRPNVLPHNHSGAAERRAAPHVCHVPEVALAVLIVSYEVSIHGYFMLLLSFMFSSPFSCDRRTLHIASFSVFFCRFLRLTHAARCKVANTTYIIFSYTKTSKSPVLTPSVPNLQTCTPYPHQCCRDTEQAPTLLAPTRSFSSQLPPPPIRLSR